MPLNASQGNDQASRVIQFVLPRPFPLLNRLMRQHHHRRAMAKRQMAQQIVLLLKGRLPDRPLRRATVTVRRYSSGTPDHDGLYGGVKDLLDCLTTPMPTARGGQRNKFGIGLIVDDSPTYIDLRVEHQPCSRSEQRTEVEIREVLS